MNVDGVKAQVVHCSLVTLFQLWGLNLFLKVCNLRSKIVYFVHLAGSCTKFEFCHLYCNSEVVKAMGLPEMRIVALFSF